MRREKIENLFLAKCRHYVEDAKFFYIDDKLVMPKPDYVDYYTIAKRNDNASFNDMCNRYTVFSDFECENCQQMYYIDDILSLTPLSDYVKSYDSLNKRECLLVLDLIEKKTEFKIKVGYFYGKHKYDNVVRVAGLRKTKKK